MAIDINSTIQSAGAAVAIIAGASGIGFTIFFYFKAKVKTAAEEESDRIAQETLTNLQTTVEALKTQNGLQGGQLASQHEQLIALNGKVDTLSTIPLGKIEKHMADTNNMIQALISLIPTSLEKTVTETTTNTKLS
jgi:hypothetical protein